MVEGQELVCEGIRGCRRPPGTPPPLQQQASEVRAVLLNRRLPGERAGEVFDAMRDLCPDLPVILVTGNPEAIARAELARSGLVVFLQKAFKSLGEAQG